MRRHWAYQLLRASSSGVHLLEGTWPQLSLSVPEQTQSSQAKSRARYCKFPWRVWETRRRVSQSGELNSRTVSGRNIMVINRLRFWCRCRDKLLSYEQNKGDSTLGHDMYDQIVGEYRETKSRPRKTAHVGAVFLFEKCTRSMLQSTINSRRCVTNRCRIIFRSTTCLYSSGRRRPPPRRRSPLRTKIARTWCSN